jgi:hypothetical protein
VLPGGRKLVTLKDAGTCITRLPRAEHEAVEWLAAMEALILVAERGCPTMLPRIGMMRALNAGGPVVTAVHLTARYFLPAFFGRAGGAAGSGAIANESNQVEHRIGQWAGDRANTGGTQ